MSLPLILILLPYRVSHSPLAADNVGVQNESVFESTTAQRTHLAGNDAAFEPLVPAQGCRSFIRFSASVAHVHAVGRALLPAATSGFIVRCGGGGVVEMTLAPGQLAVVLLRQ